MINYLIRWVSRGFVGGVCIAALGVPTLASPSLMVTSIYKMQDFGAEIRLTRVARPPRDVQLTAQDMLLSAAKSLTPSRREVAISLQVGPVPLEGEGVFGETDFDSAKAWFQQIGDRLQLKGKDLIGLRQVLRKLDREQRYFYGYNPYGIETSWGFYSSLLLMDAEMGMVYDVRFPKALAH